MKVRPAENPDAPGTRLLVRHPGNHLPLAAEGAEVVEDGYWLRRLRDGDVELVEESGEEQQATQVTDQDAKGGEPTTDQHEGTQS